MQYQFQFDNKDVGPIRDTWEEAVQDARDNGCNEFADKLTFPGGGDSWSKSGPSIMRIAKPGERVFVSE